jgi:DNA-directed RNA polymerase subunit RPC12/RpoP
MPIEFKYKCPNCSWTIKWVYDEEKEKLQSDGLVGCPGPQCTRLHEISAQNISENKAKEIMNDRFER